MRIELVGFLKTIVKSDELTLKIESGMKLKDFLVLLPLKLRAELLDPRSGMLRTNFLVLVNGVEIKTLQGLSTDISDDDLLTLIPISHGGSVRYEKIPQGIHS